MEWTKRRIMLASKFDMADYLDSEEMIAEFLNIALEENHTKDVVTVNGHIARVILIRNIKSLGEVKIVEINIAFYISFLPIISILLE